VKHRHDPSGAAKYEQLRIAYNDDAHIIMLEMAPMGRPCFTVNMLNEIKHAQDLINTDKYPFLLLTSAIDGVFNYGGDLDTFIKLIKDKNRPGLDNYMCLCLNVLQPKSTLDCSLYRVAVVQGAALGGGFEAALSCDYIIAEEQSRFGFPEKLFGQFAGMGAINFLISRTDKFIAKRIFEGGSYTATEMFELNVIDQVVPNGAGRNLALEYIKNLSQNDKVLRTTKKINKMINGVRYEVLLEVGKIWVDNALNTSHGNLKRMERLVRAQTKKTKTVS